MFKWWFLLVFLPSLKGILSILWIFMVVFLVVIGIFIFINFLEYQDELRRNILFEFEKNDKIIESQKTIKNFYLKIFRKIGIAFAIITLLLLVIPSKTSIVEMFTANTILTKENTELISKIPNKSLKYLDKIIQEKLNEKKEQDK